MHAYEQSDYYSVQAPYTANWNNTTTTGTSNTMAKRNQFSPRPDSVGMNRSTNSYGESVQAGFLDRDDIDTFGSSYVQHYVQTAPDLSTSNPTMHYTHGANGPSGGPINDTTNRYTNRFSNGHAQHDKLSFDSTQGSYGIPVQRDAPGRGSMYGFENPDMQHDYDRVPPNASSSDYATQLGYNPYAQPQNVDIPTSNAQHSQVLGQESSKKLKGHSSGGGLALTPAQVAKQLKRKRTKASGGPRDSAEKLAGRGRSIKRTKLNQDEDYGQVDEADEEESGAEEPEESKKRRSKENNKGETSMINGQLHWMDPETGKWTRAVRHHDIRHLLIAKAQRLHPGQLYDHPDPTGGLLYNETSFKLDQQSWGERRHHRPNWAFQWKPTATIPGPSPPKPGSMMYKCKVVLDPSDRPVKDHHNIPLTLSSRISGCKMQLMKMQNPAVEQIDFWARMPVIIPESGRKTGTKSLSSINTTVNMPMMRFREKQGALSWSEREGSASIEGNLTRFFAFYGFNPVHSNSTIGFNRDLNPWESKLVKLTNVGSAPKRGGTNALPAWTKYERKVKEMQKIQAKNKALYLAVMGAPAPELDLTLKPGYQEGYNDVVEVKKDLRARNRRSTEDTDEDDVSEFDAEDNATDEDDDYEDPITIHGRKRTSRPGQFTENTRGSVEYGGEPDVNGDTDDDEDPVVIRRRRRTSGTAKTGQIPRIRNEELALLESRHEHIEKEEHTTEEYREGAELIAQTQVSLVSASSHEQGSPCRMNGRQRQTARTFETQKGSNRGEIVSNNEAGSTPIIDIPHAADLHARRKRTRDLLGEANEVGYQPPRKRCHIAEHDSTAGFDMTDDEQEGVEQSDGPTNIGTVRKAPRQIHRTQRLPPPAPNGGRPVYLPQLHPGDLLAENVAKILAKGIHVTDFTKVAPSSEQEMNSLDKALQLTRAAYVEIIGLPAPVTDRRDCYAAQWQHIFNCFGFDWSMCDISSNQNQPYLFQLSRENWGQSLMDWKYMEDGQLTPESLTLGVSELESVDPDAVNGFLQVKPDIETKPDVEEDDAKTDYRELVPATEFDRYSVERVLKMTRNAFLKKTGTPASETDRQASYATQYWRIQAPFEIWWAAENSQDTGLDDVPRLVAWSAEEFKRYMWGIQEEAAEEAAAEAAAMEDEVDWDWQEEEEEVEL